MLWVVPVLDPLQERRARLGLRPPNVRSSTFSSKANRCPKQNIQRSAAETPANIVSLSTIT